jgi:RNA polymerase sigma-70 factor (ECF subfamily)
MRPAPPLHAGRAGQAAPPPGNHDDDDALVERVRAGEREAFAILVRRHQRDVWKVVSALLGNPSATEGLVQQSFVNAYERLGQYERGRDLGRWLKGIARNLVREELRRRGREAERLTHYHAYLRALHDDEDHAAARAERIAQALAACRDGLAPTAARALALRYDEALELEAVAAALGRTLAATRQLLFRTREALRQCVEERLGAE